MHRGYVKLHRRIVDSFFYENPKFLSLFIHLLVRATYKDKTILVNGKKILLKAGCLLTSRKNISLETGLPESFIQRALKVFEKENVIKQSTNNFSRIISVVNWSQYQEDENSDTTQSSSQVGSKNEHQIEQQIEQQNEHQDYAISACEYNNILTLIFSSEQHIEQQGEHLNEQQMNNKRTTDEQQMNTYKKEKKEKKEKKDTKTIVFFENEDPVAICSFFKDKDFQEAWKEWIQVRTRKKASKSPLALIRAVKKLMRFSSGNKSKAIDIVNKSADSGWSDLYGLKEDAEKTSKNEEYGGLF